MKFNTIKLGTVCFDKATQKEGTITHCVIDLDQRIDYLFQPRGLNPVDGQPIARIIAERGRLILPPDCFEEVDVPFEILGSIVTDKASGFSGMAIAFVQHINGCFHIRIQPSGTIQSTNSTIQYNEFDLRGCEGDKIKQLSEEQIQESQKKNPSPIVGLPRKTFNEPSLPSRY